MAAYPRPLREGQAMGLDDILGQVLEQAGGTSRHRAAEAVSAADVDQALSPAEIDQVAQKLGVSREQAAGVLAEILPGVVDAVTPSGDVPSAEELARRIAS
jgi:uncharacterized protein YidB (DUF937 family)